MRLFVLIAAVVLVSACTTIDPYTGEQKASNTSKGAATGAIAGAILGAATSSKKDREKGILTGAAAGAAAGGGIGYYMDRQAAVLRQRLQGSGVQVRKEGDTVHLVMPGNITFQTGSSVVLSSFYPVLNSVAEVLNEFKKTSIKVSGHTDSVGAAEYNQTLSEQRAGSVRSYLIGRQVASGRVHSVGYGERYPVASNSSIAGKQQNRRVELELQPIQ